MMALTSLMAKIKIGLFAALIVFAFSMTYLSKTLYEKASLLEAHNNALFQELRQTEITLSRLETSCQVTEKITSEVAIESEKLTTNIQEIVEAIDGITRREERTNVQPPIVGTPADNNAELGRLLDDAYCSAAPADTYCAAGQSSGGKAGK